MKSIEELFVLNGMNKANILSGHSGLSRNVEHVSISDTPHLLKFLREGHLLLTSGYPFKDDVDRLYDTIKQMNLMNCSGIIIKMDRYIKTLPKKVEDLSNKLNFPIIDSSSTDFTLNEISYDILNFLNNHKYGELDYAFHTHNELSVMIKKGYNLSSIIKKLGTFFERPVFLFNHRGDIIAQSQYLKHNSKEFEKDRVLKVIKENLSVARNGSTLDYFTSDNLPTDKHTISTYPIQTSHQIQSFLAIVNATTLPYPMSELSINQACNLISFTLIKQQAIKEKSNFLKNSFFTDLLADEIDSSQEIFNQCNNYGLNSKMDTVCIICSIDKETNNKRTNNITQLQHQIYNYLEDEIISENITNVLFIKEPFVVILLQFPHYTEYERFYINKMLNKAQKYLKDESDISFGVSKQIQSLLEIPIAYKESLESIINGYDLNMTNFIRFYKTRNLEELLNLIPRRNLTEFYENNLKSLAYSRSDKEKDLLKTLYYYINSQCSIAKTSEVLFIHRNTVKYRINNLEEILNCSLTNSSDLINIQVALLIDKLLNSN